MGHGRERDWKFVRQNSDCGVGLGFPSLSEKLGEQHRDSCFNPQDALSQLYRRKAESRELSDFGIDKSTFRPNGEQRRLVAGGCGGRVVAWVGNYAAGILAERG